MATSTQVYRVLFYGLSSFYFTHFPSKEGVQDALQTLIALALEKKSKCNPDEISSLNDQIEKWETCLSVLDRMPNWFQEKLAERILLEISVPMGDWKCLVQIHPELAFSTE